MVKKINCSIHQLLQQKQHRLIQHLEAILEDPYAPTLIEIEPPAVPSMLAFGLHRTKPVLPDYAEIHQDEKVIMLLDNQIEAYMPIEPVNTPVQIPEEQKIVFELSTDEELNIVAPQHTFTQETTPIAQTEKQHMIFRQIRSVIF